MDIEAVEAVRIRATNLVPTLTDLSYPDKLEKLGLPTLSYRRSRGDMIEMLKIVNGVYGSEICNGIFMN